MKWWICLLLFSQQVYAQVDPKGSTPETGVAGNPFFLKDWSDGVIRFSSGMTSNKFKLKFNCAQNRLLLQFNGTVFGAESKVSEFVIFPKNKKDSFLFRKGYPEIGLANAETYYEVLVQGKATLLQLHRKNIIEERQVLDSKASRFYEAAEELFVFMNGTMHKIEDRQDAIATIFSDKSTEVTSWITDQKLKLRSPSDYVQVVKWYNSL